jgi:HAE1 family hydrophobic/amphiphilic exporter-1/multidrug efflux pump
VFAKFFIHRPVFAIVISIVIVLVGGLSILTLPIAQFPSITPPTVTVEASYTGASAVVVEGAVATAIEKEINGASNMTYMSSRSASDGSYQLTVTFKVGTDLDLAAVDVQNRVQKAESSLPAEVRTAGLTVTKKSPDMLMVITLYSPDRSYDALFLTNFATLNVVNNLLRVDGVGASMLVPQRDYAMRIWLRPDKLAKLGLTAGDIATAIQDQNRQAPAGQVGQPPAKPGVDFQYTVNVKGQLSTIGEFEDLVVRMLPDGSLLRIKDVARTELGGQTYSSFGRLNGLPATLVVINQRPGANALETAKGVRATLAQLSKTFPPGLTYQITMDNTRFITASIEEVLHTLGEAVLLVLIVVFLFLGSFRATLIPMLAVPVSLIGTFALFVPLGFSINTLTLFGLVLAIGIVVDDAIVVVEAVEHHIGQGLTPMAATEKAMSEVSGPVMAIALVLCAVFLPVAFLGGITGELYRQFAVTLCISVLLSALVALTLTPALCTMILRARTPMRGPLGAVVRGFNRVFERATASYTTLVRAGIRHAVLMLGLLLVFMVGAGVLLKILPTGFVPSEDQGYFFSGLTLPDGASMERTDLLAQRDEKFLKQTPGIENVASMGGFNLLTGAFSSNSVSFIATLTPWNERKAADVQLTAILERVQREFAAYPEAVGLAFSPPPIPGLGTSGGFQFEVQDRAGRGVTALARVAQDFVAEAHKRPELAGLYNSLRTSIPQITVEVDRDKVKTLGIPLQEVFAGLQAYLGGLIVNDLSLFGRSWKVMIQAEPEFRLTPDNIASIYVRNADDQMVPLGTLSKIVSTTGPDIVQRYNVLGAAEISGGAAPGFSSGQAITAMEDVARTALPDGYGFEWTGTAYQEKQASRAQALIFGLAIVLVFLFLAAQYESWGIPFGVILGLPLGALGAFFAVWLRGLINDVYVQIGLVMLVGLAAKNAILIVEFAKEMYERDRRPVVEAAVEAARLRFRPILMTSFAFILGVVPLVVASGAGAFSRRSLGTAVFGGMTVATALGVFFIPMLFVVIERLRHRIGGRKPEAVSSGETSLAEGGHG